MPSNHLILHHPLLLLPLIFPSIRVFSNEPALCIKWPKYWEFQLQYQSFQWTAGLISFRMDWLDLLAVHGTLKSLLQHHSSKASILQCSAFFIVWLSYPYMTIGQLTGSKLGKEYNNAICCHSAYLTSMQGTKNKAGWLTSWNQDCWEKNQQPQICRWYHYNRQKAKRN